MHWNNFEVLTLSPVQKLNIIHEANMGKIQLWVMRRGQERSNLNYPVIKAPVKPCETFSDI